MWIYLIQYATIEAKKKKLEKRGKCKWFSQRQGSSLLFLVYSQDWNVDTVSIGYVVLVEYNATTSPFVYCISFLLLIASHYFYTQPHMYVLNRVLRVKVPLSLSSSLLSCATITINNVVTISKDTYMPLLSSYVN